MFNICEYHAIKYQHEIIILIICKLELVLVDIELYRFLVYLKQHKKSTRVSLQNRFGVGQTRRMLKLLSDIGLVNENPEFDVPVPVSSERALIINTIDLFISANCNLSCRYCFEKTLGWKYRHTGTMSNLSKTNMSKSIAEQSVDFLINLSDSFTDLYICFFGGEPLLNFNLLEHTVIYAISQGNKFKKRFHFSLTTNGTILSDSMIAFLSKYNISILISIDGIPFTQNKNRPYHTGKNSYDSINRNLENLRKNKINYSARVTVCKDDIEKILTNYRHLCSLEFKNIHFEIAFGNEFEFLINSNNDLNKINYQQRKITEEFIRTFDDNNYLHFETIRRPLEVLFSKSKLYYSCIIGQNYLAIDCNGRIYLCHRLVGAEEFFIGEVKDCTFNKKWIEYIGKKMSVDIRNNCRTCWARYLCGGGCFAMNYDKNNNIDITTMEYCQIKKYSIKMAIVIFTTLVKKQLIIN